MTTNSRKSATATTSTSYRHQRDRADLHIHTTHSDGVCSPCEVVVAAARVGLGALAITDHDTVSGLALAQPEAKWWNIELVDGIELTCQQGERELHILGYFIRTDDPSLLETLESIRGDRVTRFEAMAEKLRTLGFSIDLSAVRRIFPRANLGRRHLADFLVRTHQVASLQAAFRRFLADGCPAWVDKPRIASDQGITLLRGAGGVAALAHPPYDLREGMLQSLVEEGLQAIEVDGSGISKQMSQRIRAWADRFGLIGIAGSDFHAADRPGRWVGAITTDRADLERLRTAKDQNRMDGGTCCE